MSLNRETIIGLWKKYKYAVLIVLAGVLLMLLPTGTKSAGKEASSTENGENFSLEEVEEKMETILGQIQGTGKLRIMLTLQSASQLQLAEDTDESLEQSGDNKSRHEPVTINRGSGTQEVVVTGQIYPVFQGAVVVCEGADDSAVRLAITEAVAALTGLRTDKISIVKWQS
ncbi:MAG: stage III sporulation protein AG [Clostridiales bacterium]|nr:stage III sporulation protein AG [Candidatus Cacconaster stercorequi]